MKKEKEIIYYRESWLSSIISDANTFGMLIGGFYLNETFCNGNNWLSAILTIIFITTVASKGAAKCKRFYSYKDLQDYLTVQQSEEQS